MTTVGNGQSGGNEPSTRRWNPEDLVRRGRPSDIKTVSGRRFVIAGVIGILLVWGAVLLGFRAWRAQYEALAAYGATQIAPLVDPLADHTPPGVDPVAWRQSVADTHAMLLALTGSAMLEQPMMETLHSEIAALVARSTPLTAQRELTTLWDNLERKAGPIIAPDLFPPTAGTRHAARHPRPARPEILKTKTEPILSNESRGPP